MIGSFGVLDTGVVIKRITDITQQMNDGLTGDLGVNFSLLSVTPEGQLVNRMAQQAADLWEFGEMVYNAYYPDTANGVSLDNAMALGNTPRIPNTASVANGVVITGTPGTPVPSNFQLSVTGSPASIFQVYGSYTIGGGGTVAASFVALANGPTVAAAGTLTNIVQAVSGIASATNPADAQLGTIAETDAQYRARNLQQRSAPGTATVTGITKALLATLNVSLAIVFENVTNAVDANGLQPKSIMAIVVGGADADIANTLYANRGAGIGTNGTTTVTVYDSQNVPHQVSFNRLSNVPIYMTIKVTKNTNPSAGPVYPGNGAVLVANAVLAFGATYIPGQTVSLAGFQAAAFIPGVDALTINFATTPSPTGNADIPMLPYQLATFTAVNLTVT